MVCVFHTIIYCVATLLPGLGDFHMQLSSEPVLGTWKITVQLPTATTSQTFKVEEYGKPSIHVHHTWYKYISGETPFFEQHLWHI